MRYLFLFLKRIKNKKAIKQKQIVFKIKRDTRNQIFKRYDYEDGKISETGWKYYVLVSEEVLKNIKRFYTSKCFNKENHYVETNVLKDFILSTSPYCVEYCGRFYQLCGSSYHALRRNVPVFAEEFTNDYKRHAIAPFLPCF